MDHPKMLKPLHFCSAKIIPLVFDNSLSYYEQLCAFSAKLNSIIDYVNSMSLGLTEFYELIIKELDTNYATTAEFNEFKEYILDLISHIVGGGVGQTVEAGTVYNVGGVDYTAGTNAEIFNTYSGEIANKAAGDYSHSEGSNTAALATGSHAEGLQTIATGNGSHAEGTGCQATAQGAHAENAVNVASGVNSHCGGNNSESGGVGSFVHGNHCESNTNYQTVIGQYNDSGVNHPFVIGNGAEGSPHNAFSIDSNGLVYINGAATGINIATMIIPITQNDYDNLAVKNPTTLYVIIPENP